MVKGAMDHIGINMRGKHGERENPDRIAKDTQGQDKERYQSLFPAGLQKQVGGQKAREKQNEAGANPAAFLGDLDVQPGQGEEKPFTEIGGATQVHHPGVNLRGGMLGGDFESGREPFGKRHNEDRECERKPKHPGHGVSQEKTSSG